MWQDVAVSGVSTSSHLTTKSHHHISTPGKLLPSNGAPVKMATFCSWEDNNNNNNNNPICKAPECQKTSVAQKRLPYVQCHNGFASDTALQTQSYTHISAQWPVAGR